MRRPWRLRTSLALSFTLLFIVTFIAVSAITMYESNEAFQESMDSDLQSMAGTIEARLASGQTPQTIVENLSSAVRYIELRDASGRTIARSSNLAGARLPVRVAPGTTAQTFHDGELKKVAFRIIVYPLMRGGVVDGYVVAGTAQREFQDLFLSVVPGVAAAGLVGLVIAVGGTVWLSDRSTRPLTELAARVNAAARHEFNEEIDPPPGGSAEAQQLGEAFRELIHRQRQEMQRERAFFADSSHVLRTPLAVASGNVDLLAEGAEGAERTRVVARLRAALDSMARTVSGLLLLAREQDPSAATSTWEAVPLSEQLPSLVAEAQAAHPGVRFSTDVPPGLVLAGDRQQLRDLFSTVLENSGHYTPDGGQVAVSAQPDSDGCVVVEVCDTGIGLTAEEAQRASERFFRGARARALEPGGAGLGLSIADRIVRLHHGTFSIAPRTEVAAGPDAAGPNAAGPGAAGPGAAGPGAAATSTDGTSGTRVRITLPLVM